LIQLKNGITISQNPTKDVFDLYKKGNRFDFVVTVCDKEASERCPVFPGLNEKINWSFDDPSKFMGSYADRLAATRILRNRIKEAVINFINKYSI